MTPRRGQARAFYLVLAVIAVAGIGALLWLANRPAKAIRTLTVQPTAAQAEGYLAGNPDAPVQVLEFADFQCPACAQFSTLTEPDIRQRLVDQGTVSFRYFDFPLQQHQNSLRASIAAACAADQGKFWPMHDLLFQQQPYWSEERNPRGKFLEYAAQAGVDQSAWKSCYDEQRHLERIMDNSAEGERRGVTSTPTFIIGTQMIAGALAYDQFKALVDTALAHAPARPTAPAASHGDSATPALP
ncbi:MAG TPA: thioredoxin domain-containing protein [Gemmatimonadaceae bacterium]|nr:thioredoxin domain-containing protein [Gemmatimonadaceae bacterium]